MNIRFQWLTRFAMFFTLAYGLNSFSDEPDPCSRSWATGKNTSKNFRITGLGISSQPDPRSAAEEARAAAFKDISLQLQSSVQSKSEIKESHSDASFQSNSVLTSETKDLVGLKAIKSGKAPNEKITDCEVYEFNVQ